MDWIEEFVRPGMAVVDVGANEGEVTWRFLNEKATVTAIEPDPRMATTLRATYTAATVVEAAATNYVGVTTLHQSAEALHSSLSQSAVLHWIGAIEVPAVTLDSLGVFDVVKIDAQGAELQILQGATKTLETRNAVWFVELWRTGLEYAGASVDAIADLFERYGYVPREGSWDEIRRIGNAQKGHSAIDVLILPAER